MTEAVAKWHRGGIRVIMTTGDYGLTAESIARRIGIIRGDLRGYWRAAGQAVVAARIQYEGADRRLPDYERLLVGGASTLRGTRVGALIGDRALGASAELRVPITSPLSFARFGATAFFDMARAYDVGQRSGDVRWSRGTGAGVFMIFPFVKLNFHFAHSLDGNGNRLHVSSGFTPSRSSRAFPEVRGRGGPRPHEPKPSNDPQ